MVKHGKTLLSLLLAVVMLLGMMQTVAFAGVDNIESNAIITLTENTEGATLNPGDTFTVVAEIKNNPGFNSAAFNIEFDKSALTAIACVCGYDDDEEVNYNFGSGAVYNLNKGNGAFITTAFADAYTKDKKLFKLTFQVNENAASGEYEIKINDQHADHLFDYMDENNVAHTYTAQYVPATVTVAGIEPEPDPILVTGVELNKTSLEFTLGSETLSETLTATVLPEDAENKAVAWSTSNASVATVEDGVVTAVGEGTAIITVTTADGGFTAE